MILAAVVSSDVADKHDTALGTLDSQTVLRDSPGDSLSTPFDVSLMSDLFSELSRVPLAWR